MTKTKTGYKIFRKEGGGLVSMFDDHHHQMPYKNKRNHRRLDCGALGVFKRAVDAENFRAGFDGSIDFVIHKVKYKPSTIKELFFIYQQDRPFSLPQGTRFADWVEIIK